MQLSRPELERCVHGSISPAELQSLGLSAGDVIDFSANINPLGVSPRVLKAVASADVARYPDPDCLELRQALSRAKGLAIEGILVGNGSTELIHLLARACLAGGGSAAILAPTFGEYEVACRLVGVRPSFIFAREEDGFRWDTDQVCQEIGLMKPRLVFLCNPDNPTGLYLDMEAVQQIATATAPGILAIDEAYVSFVEEPWQATSLLELGNEIGRAHV
jgi:histidinol-phosphate aminotransferase